jgi:EAL domain-containing protein (putative c-di-GMP-specific phosphodiesterase class I)
MCAQHVEHGLDSRPGSSGEAPQPMGSARLRLLRDCLHGVALVTLFQPILDLRQGRVLGYEALSRGPAGSPLESAEALFGCGRDHGLAHDLELVALRRAVERFGFSSRPGRLFVNLSPLTLAERSREVNVIVDRARRVGLSPRDIVIELAENQSIDSTSSAWEALRERRAAGFGVAIDDFGQGFASLRLWSELHPEYVKLDKHFVQGIHRDALKLRIARAVREIAEVAGSAVIAEGIESAEDLRVVRDLDISLCQGYLIGRPAREPRVAEAFALCRPATSGHAPVLPA